MASLKVFVSSTCYDLNIVRAELREFLINLGHEPIMSDFNDVLFDPRLHTHESCVQEIANADAVILIIGSRYGGTAIPTIISALDLDNLKALSKGSKMLEHPEKMSITQLEVLKAVESSIPIFTFIDARVAYNHLFYEKNKNKDILSSLEFPGIERKENAIYIFEFINYLRLRSKNNSIAEFSKLSDIQDYLKKQWSYLLQRLLYEQKNKIGEEKRLDFLSKQIEDIKTAILTTIPNDELKDTAKGAIKFRGVLEFFLEFKVKNSDNLLLGKLPWEKLFEEFGIKELREVSDPKRKFSSRTGVAFVMKDESKFFFNRYMTLESLEKYVKKDWEEFKELPDNRKNAIFNAIKDNFVEDRVRHIEEIMMPLADWIKSAKTEE